MCFSGQAFHNSPRAIAQLRANIGMAVGTREANSLSIPGVAEVRWVLHHWQLGRTSLLKQTTTLPYRYEYEHSVDSTSLCLLGVQILGSMEGAQGMECYLNSNTSQNHSQPTGYS